MKTIERQVLRDIFKSIDKRQGAIVLNGPGGIGKSTLITRTAAVLRRKGFEFIVVRGCTTVEQILEAIALKAESLGVGYAEKFFNAFDEPGEKLTWYLDRFLLKQKAVIIFHHFEENQDEKKAGEFKQERLKKFLWVFRDRLTHHETFLLFSTRYTIPSFDAPGMTTNIPGFSSLEFRKILLNSKALKQLDEKSLETGDKIGDKKRMADSLHQIGIIYQFKGDYESAFNHVNKSLEIKKNIGDTLGIAKSLLLIGMFYYNKIDYDAALASFQESKEEYGKIAHYRGVKGVSSAWYWMGMVYQARGDYDAALDYFQKSNEEFDKIADFKDMGYNFYRIGMIYNDKGDYDAALHNLHKAKEVFEKNRDSKNVSNSLHEMGKVYQKKSDYEAALEYFLRAFRHFADIGDPNANLVREDIARIRENMPEKQFNSILQEFNLPANFFDNDEEREQEEFVEFLAALTRDAAAAKEKSSEEKEQLSARLNQFIEKLADTPEGSDLKSYFRLLLAVINGKDYREYLEKISEGLKELFEEI
jgi:tetratricopeptide (TPR) repeat protein